MNYSKLLFAFCLFVVLVNSSPIPGFGDFFNNLFGNHEEVHQSVDNYDEYIDNPADLTPYDASGEAEAPAPAPEAPIEAPAPAPEAPVEAPVEAPAENHNPFDDFFAPITEGDVGKNTDIASLVTDGVINVLKNELCSRIENELGQVCTQLSESIINAVSGTLRGVISSSINAVTGNAITIACSVIPSDIFRNLSSVIVDAISKEIAKNGEADNEKATRIAHNVINIIINSVDNLLCAGRQKDSIGNVIVNGVTDLANNIMNKIKKMDNKAVMSFKSEDDFNAAISKDVYEFQENLKSLLM